MSPLELIKISRDEYDRLVELSPIMPLTVVQEFNRKFNKNLDLTKPEICDELSSTNVFTLSNTEREKLIQDIDRDKLPKEDPKITHKKHVLKQQIDAKTERFKKTFHSLNGRYPTTQEIRNNLNRFGTNDVDGFDDLAEIDNTPNPMSNIVAETDRLLDSKIMRDSVVVNMENVKSTLAHNTTIEEGSKLVENLIENVVDNVENMEDTLNNTNNTKDITDINDKDNVTLTIIPEETSSEIFHESDDVSNDGANDVSSQDKKETTI